MTQSAMAMRAAILIIDDDPVIRRVLAKAVADIGFEPLVAGTAVEGVAQAVHDIPMGIIVDATLPDIPLISVLRLLSSIPTTKAIPLFVLALRLSPTTTDSLRSIGVRGFIEKPFTKTSLEQRLTSVYGVRIMTMMKQRRHGLQMTRGTTEQYADHHGRVSDITNQTNNDISFHDMIEPIPSFSNQQQHIAQRHIPHNDSASAGFTAVGSDPHFASRREQEQDSAQRTLSQHSPVQTSHHNQPDYVSMSLAEVARMYGDRNRSASTQAMRDILDTTSA
jgi:CheY-like chemotaxis protein